MLQPVVAIYAFEVDDAPLQTETLSNITVSELEESGDEADPAQSHVSDEVIAVIPNSSDGSDVVTQSAEEGTMEINEESPATDDRSELDTSEAEEIIETNNDNLTNIEVVTTEVLDNTDSTTVTPTPVEDQVPTTVDPNTNENIGLATTSELADVPLFMTPEELIDTPLNENFEVETGATTTLEAMATSSIELEDEILPLNVLATDSTNHYKFAEDECRIVGDGTYFCAVLNEQSSLDHDAVFTKRDNDGDLEIFVRLNGVEGRVTNNNVDDSAPFYDESSKSLIWQSLRDERYQIVKYDLETNEEEQLTHTAYNNMQPTASGGVYFWQAWLDDNWEIVRLEGDEVIRMTNNEVHDISPYAENDLVMWQTEIDGNWKISLYNLKTKEHQYIDSEKSISGVTKNPRFLLVYDLMDENGKIVPYGYDFRNNRHIPLEGKPLPLPKDLPSPNGDDEERALINAKPNLKNDSDPLNEDDLGSGDAPPILPEEFTIVVPSTDITNEGEVEEIIQSDEVIESEQVPLFEDIPDLVIPPYQTEDSAQ